MGPTLQTRVGAWRKQCNRLDSATFLVVAGRIIAVLAAVFATLGLILGPSDAATMRFSPVLTLVLAAIGLGMVFLGRVLQGRRKSR